jgi:hypothetical protein
MAPQILMDNEFARKLFETRSAIPERMDIYRTQLAAFREKFGRDMGPGDPFFFDPDAETPRFRPPEDADFALDFLAQLMAESGLDPAAIYAFKRTRGLFPSGSKALSRAEQAEWDAAIREYHQKLSSGAGQ